MAGGLALGAQFEDLPDLAKRQPGGMGILDEHQPLHGPIVALSVTVAGSFGLRQHPDALVVTNGLGRYPGLWASSPMLMLPGEFDIPVD